MNPELIFLNHIVYDSRARDGTWCKLPYPGHPAGCPNFPKCVKEHPDFNLMIKGRLWDAVLEEFNLTDHAAKMKKKHPAWSERQCRNLLYWQNGVKSRLRKKVLKYSKAEDIVLELPEACGVNVFETMSKNGIALQRHNPDIIIKVMLIGRRGPEE